MTAGSNWKGEGEHKASNVLKHKMKTSNASHSLFLIQCFLWIPGIYQKEKDWGVQGKGLSQQGGC